MPATATERRPSGPPSPCGSASQRRPIRAVRKNGREGNDRPDQTPAACVLADTHRDLGLLGTAIAKHALCRGTPDRRGVQAQCRAWHVRRWRTDALAGIRRDPATATASVPDPVSCSGCLHRIQ